MHSMKFESNEVSDRSETVEVRVENNFISPDWLHGPPPQ
jgi:hypothetical protein